MDARTASYLAEILAQLVAVQAMRGINETRAYDHQAQAYDENSFEDAMKRADDAREALGMEVDHQERQAERDTLAEERAMMRRAEERMWE